MSSRIRHVINNDNPETLQISQFYAKYCNPTITAISATITTSTKTTTTTPATTTTTTPATTTTTTPATTATTTKSAISARSGNKQSDACICSRNRKTFRKTWDSTFHHLSLPGMIHYPEFHFIIPISHKRSVTTTKDHSFPDLTQASKNLDLTIVHILYIIFPQSQFAHPMNIPDNSDQEREIFMIRYDLNDKFSSNHVTRKSSISIRE
ncbi:unnamed protein product [Onchocerca ochengi]|uniref:Uncharacterized protein n=1 Tax=Onchocerca ochengi TaxID=42157 RepID=A0A182ESR8_ONCOC|nr:unnamed protein product [Onchocerca ochengi]